MRYKNEKQEMRWDNPKMNAPATGLIAGDDR